MADYRLTKSGEEVQNILDNATPQSELTAETQRATEAEQTLQGNIDNEETRAKGAERTLQENIDAEALTRGQADTTLQGNIDAEEARAKAAEKQNADDIDAIEGKIPAAASDQNQLADKQFVNSSIQTSTAEYKGAFNSVSDLHLTTSATRLQIAAALPNVILSADNNDYCFVQVPVADATPTVIASVERYKYNGSQWLFEYALNNSGFTQAQWDALNSGITSGLVTKLSALPTNAELATLLAGKQAVIADLQTIREGAAAGATAVQPAALQSEAETRAVADTALGNRVSIIEGKIPVAASPQNQLADKHYVDDGISTATAEFKGAYNLVTDLHLTITATRSEIATELGAVISGADNNDYAYVQIPVANDAPTTIAKVERYKYNGSAWAFEYELNNSGFTAAQWAAINSGITSGLVSKLSDLPTLAQLSVLLNGKQNTLTFDTAPTEGSSNPVTSGGIFTGISSAIAAALTAYYTKAQTYSQTEVQQLISTTIASYYTKSEVDAAIANFITKSVNDLTNYYLKSETFTKAEVNQLIAAVQQFTYQSVAELPTASAETMNKIYLVPSTNPQQQNVKDEFITVSVTDQGTTTYSWEQIGTTTVDLSGYSTTQQMNTAISNAIATALADYYTKAQTMTSTEINSAIATALLDYTTTSGMTTAINTAINTALADYSTTTQMTSAINAAIALAIADYYTKTEIDALIANFITASVNNLANYYLKSETFTKAEVNALIAGISQFKYQSVQTLPTASADTMGIIYLVPGADPGTQNVKDEYITISSTNEQQVTTYSWEKIGSAEINLDNYYTKSQTDAAITAALASYMTSAQAQTLVVTSIQTALGSYYNKTEIDALIGAITAKIPTEASSSNQLADKAYVAAQVQEYVGTFRGTFASVAELEATTGNHHNDYAWVQVTDSDGDNDYDRYKYNGTAWVFEYRLNNTHFTAAELAAIRSGITSEKVVKLDSIPSATELSTINRRTRLANFDLAVLKQAVADQNLEKYGLKVGDYKTINGHDYVIAGLNVMKGPSTPYRVNVNHVGLIVIPHTTQAWNASGNTYTGADSRGAGYANSDLHYYLVNTLLPLVKTDLGAANLLAHSKLLSNAVNQNGINRYGEATGCSSGWGWVADQYISALSEVQVYGSIVWSSSGFDTGEACRQLDVFRHFNHTEIFGGEYPWLRDVVSASVAAIADISGYANYNTASIAYYVAALILFN